MALATKLLPQKDGLDQRVSVERLNINDESKKIQLVYFIETLSPSGNVVSKSEEFIFIVENKDAIPSSEEGIDLVPKDYAYDNLKGSMVGKQICAMISERLNKLF